MKYVRNSVENKLVAIRNLTTSSLGSLLSDRELDRYGISRSLRSTLSEVGHKIRTRLESYRVVLQLADLDLRQRSSTELAKSLVSYLPEIINRLEQFGVSSSVYYSEACQHAIDNFLVQMDGLGENIENIPRASQLFSNELKAKFGGPTAYLYSVLLSIRIAEKIKFSNESNSDRIHREINFPPEFQQAGLAILNYFTEILFQKYPDTPVSVSIKQIGVRVVLEIVAPDGSVEQVERVLEQYGMVVQGRMRSNELLSDPIDIMRLNQKLELVNLELKQTREILQLQKDYSGLRIKSLEEQMATLTNIIGVELRSRDSLLSAFATASNYNIQELTPRVIELLNTLSKAMMDRNEIKVSAALEDLEATDPNIFTTLCQFVYSSAASGVIGDSASNWLKSLFTQLAK